MSSGVMRACTSGETGRQPIPEGIELGPAGVRVAHLGDGFKPGSPSAQRQGQRLCGSGGGVRLDGVRGGGRLRTGGERQQARAPNGCDGCVSSVCPPRRFSLFAWKARTRREPAPRRSS